MAFRLADLVECGELINTRPNSTHGYLGLRGEDRPLMFELTGDCGPDLKGKHIRFEIPPDPYRETDNEPKIPDSFAWHQIGPTGDMTANDWVRVFDCSISEFLKRSRLGEPPPTHWKRRLYLEWYSQNGRVVLECADPVLEYLDGEEWKPLPITTPMPTRDPDERDPNDTGPQIQIVEFHKEDDGTTPEDADMRKLQRMLDRQASAIDRSISGGEGADEDDDFMHEQELMDDLMESGEGVPVFSLMNKNQRMPRPEDVSEKQALSLVKRILTELAMCGVAVHVCEHYSMRDTYRYLIEEVMHERVFKELKGTGWTQNFMTSESCPACDEKAEREYREHAEEYEKEAALWKEENLKAGDAGEEDDLWPDIEEDKNQDLNLDEELPF